MTAYESFTALNTSKQKIVPLNIPSLFSRGADFQAEEIISAIIVRFGSVTLELHNNASATLIENTLKVLNNVR